MCLSPSYSADKLAADTMQPLSLSLPSRLPSSLHANYTLILGLRFSFILYFTSAIHTHANTCTHFPFLFVTFLPSISSFFFSFLSSHFSFPFFNYYLFYYIYFNTFFFFCVQMTVHRYPRGMKSHSRNISLRLTDRLFYEFFFQKSIAEFW